MYRYFDIDFKNSKNTFFGYLEKNNNILFIFLQKEGDLETNTNDILVNYIANYFMENSEFSARFLKNLIIRTNEVFNEKKTCELGLKFLSSSILLVLTNKSKYLIASSGNILASIFDKDDNLKLRTNLDNIAFELYENSEITYDMIAQNKYRKEVTNCLGGLKQLAINMTGELELELMDTILIEGINSWDNTNKDEDFAKIKIKKTERNENGKKNSFLIIITVITVFSIFTLSLLNKLQIQNYESNISKIRQNIKVYEKNGIYKNLEKEIFKLEKVYDSLYKKTLIYIPKKTEINHIKDVEYIKKLKEVINMYKDIRIKLENAEQDMVNEKYQLAQDKLDSIKNNSLKYRVEYIDKKINMARKLIIAKNNVENFEKLLQEKEYEKLKELLDQTKKIYVENDKIKLIDINLKPIYEKLKTKIDSLVQIVDKNIESSKVIENKSESKVKLNDAFNLAKMVGDNDLIERVKNEITLLEDQIQKITKEAKALKDEGLLHYKDKKYRSSLEAFLESNIRFRKLGLTKEIEENSKTIRNLKELIYKEKNEFGGKSKKSELEMELVKSVYLSIDKGDEYTSNNDFKNALTEYERALKLSNKVKIPSTTIKKLNDKISYVKEKINSVWW